PGGRPARQPGGRVPRRAHLGARPGGAEGRPRHHQPSARARCDGVPQLASPGRGGEGLRSGGGGPPWNSHRQRVPERPALGLRRPGQGRGPWGRRGEAGAVRPPSAQRRMDLHRRPGAGGGAGSRGRDRRARGPGVRRGASPPEPGGPLHGTARGRDMSAVLTIARATVREAARKKLVVALALITLVGIALTGFGFWRLAVLSHQTTSGGSLRLSVTELKTVTS